MTDISVEGVMERGVLPPNLTDNAKVILPAGRYPVQVLIFFVSGAGKIIRIRNHSTGFMPYCIGRYESLSIVLVQSSVADPDPPDPRVFGPPGSGSGSTSQRYGTGSGSCSGSGSGSFYYHAKIVRKTLIPPIL